MTCFQTFNNSSPSLESLDWPICGPPPLHSREMSASFLIKYLLWGSCYPFSLSSFFLLGKDHPLAAPDTNWLNFISGQSVAGGAGTQALVPPSVKSRSSTNISWEWETTRPEADDRCPGGTESDPGKKEDSREMSGVE